MTLIRPKVNLYVNSLVFLYLSSHDCRLNELTMADDKQLYTGQRTSYGVDRFSVDVSYLYAGQCHLHHRMLHS